MGFRSVIAEVNTLTGRFQYAPIFSSSQEEIDAVKTGSEWESLDDELVARFHRSYERRDDNECWPWTKSTVGDGYGQIKATRQRHNLYSHRLAYLISHGPIPAHRQVRHSCDNPSCCNPAHLSVGTSGDNHQDMRLRNRHLKNGQSVQSTLTWQKVNEIRALLSVGCRQIDLAERYGVGQSTVNRIARGQAWRPLPDKEGE